MRTPAPALPLIQRAETYGDRLAVVDAAGECTYAELLDASARVANALLQGRGDLDEARVAFLVAPGRDWVAAQWGIWRAGGIAVPLPRGCPRPELEYFAEDSQPETLLFDAEGATLLEPIARARGLRSFSCAAITAPVAQRDSLPAVDLSRRAMILYTSGTTSRPKGVVATHANIVAQVTTLVEAWEWSGDDRTLLCLPLHHVHGIINVLSCALWPGAVCEMHARFDANAVWEHIASGGLTVFMAVPTIYVKLIAAWESCAPERRAALSQACARMRLMVSGSAALPVPTLERWREISGHTLLERYGMTEIGMALSNPLRGRRVPGAVGTPLPGVEVRLADEQGAEASAGTPGEIEVRGPGVFGEYWRKPEATQAAFRDGWFRTGDIAVVQDGVYRILGRASIDIIKTGGHKVSALEIEDALLGHPGIKECAVVGVPDTEWGERVAAAIVLRDGVTLSLEQLREWGRQRLAAHKLPARLLVLDALPRNAMGKVAKPAVAALFADQSTIA